MLKFGGYRKSSRGRLSYLTPDRTKPITARKLGDDFDRAAVLAVLEQNAARAAEKAAAIPEYQQMCIRDRIARYLNEYGAPYNALSGEIRAAIADLAALKYEVLKKVGDAVGNTQAWVYTYPKAKLILAECEKILKERENE